MPRRRHAAVGDRENREDRVADVREDLAAVLDDRARHGRERTVEIREIRRGAHALGQARRVAEVAEPDHRMDELAIAVLDLPFEHAPARAAAEIGFEQAHRDAMLRVHFEQAPRVGMIS